MALGLTFVIVGLTFALPIRLIPMNDANLWSGRLSPEVANVYACVAWAGWAHFLYAFRGQSRALTRARKEMGTRKVLAFGASLALSLLLLLGLRSAIGPAIFGAVVWVYFIDHFLKAELAFEGKYPAESSLWTRWIGSYQPVLAFSWLSIVLLNIGQVDGQPWVLLGVSLILTAGVLTFGGWKNLASGDLRGPLLALFFIGEGLVWGTFSRYGGPVFLAGVYVFHIAAGSYFHYLGSYFMANGRGGSHDVSLHPFTILAVNLAVIGAGIAVAHLPGLGFLGPILGVQWFTLWVGLHLVASDLFPVIRRARSGIHGGVRFWNGEFWFPVPGSRFRVLGSRFPVWWGARSLGDGDCSISGMDFWRSFKFASRTGDPLSLPFPPFALAIEKGKGSLRIA